MQIQQLITSLCQQSKATNTTMNLCGIIDMQNVFHCMKHLKE